MLPSWSSVSSRLTVFIGMGPCFILTVFLVLGQARPALAVGNLQLGPVELHPSFEIDESYDDNVCRTKEAECPDPKDSTMPKDGTDWITVFRPGLLAELPMGDHSLTVEYRADFGRYAEFTTENYSDNFVKGLLSLEFPRMLSIQLKDDWKNGHDPRGFNQNVDLNFYRQNTAGARLGIKFTPKLMLTLDYANFILNYEDNSRNGFRDRTDSTVGGTIYFKFLPKTFALLEYTSTQVKFEEDNPNLGIRLDSTVQRGYLGLTWNITARSHGTLKGGYVRKDFDEADTEYKGGLVSAALEHEFSARNSVRLSADRDVRESNLETQAYYVSASGGLEWVHQFHARFSASLQGGFSRDRYPEDMTLGPKTDERIDNTWEGGVGLEYRLPDWLNTGIQYRRSQRTSSFDEFEFKDNLYSFSLKIIL